MSLPDFLTIDSTTCEIQRMVVDSDHALGDLPGVFSVIATGVVCALDRSLSIGKLFGGVGREISIQGETNQETFKLFLLPSQDIISGDKVLVGTVEYKVSDVISFPIHKEAMLQLWKQ